MLKFAEILCDVNWRERKVHWTT